MTPFLIADIYGRRGFKAAYDAAVSSGQRDLILEALVLNFMKTGSIVMPAKQVIVGRDFSKIQPGNPEQIAESGRKVLCLRRPLEPKTMLVESADITLNEAVRAEAKRRTDEAARQASARQRRIDDNARRIARQEQEKAGAARRARFGNLSDAEIATRYRVLGLAA